MAGYGGGAPGSVHDETGVDRNAGRDLKMPAAFCSRHAAGTGSSEDDDAAPLGLFGQETVKSRPIEMPPMSRPGIDGVILAENGRAPSGCDGVDGTPLFAPKCFPYPEVFEDPAGDAGKYFAGAGCLVARLFDESGGQG